MENRSFDNIFGEFPGANGIGQAGESAVQRDRDDKRYEELPVVKGPFHVRANPDEPAAGARADFFGPGSRIPTILVSPLAPKGKVDNTEYETTSILRLIADRHRLVSLPSARFGAVESLAKAFQGAK